MWELRQTRAAARHQRCSANRGLAAGSLTLLIVFAVMFGMFLVLIQFLQAVLGWTRRCASAAALLPMAA